MSILKKLKSRAGESLGEVLIAVLVAALGITILATMISASAKVIGQNRQNISDYYAANNQLELRSTIEGQPVSQGTDQVSLTGDLDGTVTVNYYIHDVAGRKIVTYRKP